MFTRSRRDSLTTYSVLLHWLLFLLLEIQVSGVQLDFRTPEEVKHEEEEAGKSLKQGTVFITVH